MTTKMRPLGVTLQIEHEGQVYYGHLFNDWNMYKTYENFDITPEDNLVLFNETFDRIPYNSDLYEILTPLVEQHIFDHEHEWKD